MPQADHMPDAMNPSGETSSSSSSIRVESSEEPVAKRHCPDNPKKLSLEPATQAPHAIEPSVDASMPKSLQGADHGPKFRKLDVQQRQQLARMHHNLGHPDAQILGNVLRDQGWPSEAIEGVKDFHCPSCFEQQRPKIARPSHLTLPRAFNDLVSIDAVTWTSAQGVGYTFYHMIDSGTNFQVAFTCESRTSKEVASQMQTYWFSWAGPPKQLMSDSAGEFCSEEFAKFLQSFDIQSTVVPTEAHWQLGKCERHGAILQDMLNKLQVNHPITCREELEQALCQCTAAKNSLSRCRGYSPEILVLGKSRHQPATVSSDEFGPSDYLQEELEASSEISQFQRNLSLRENARVAFVKSDHDLKLRRAFLQRTRPARNSFEIGQWVMYWRDGKGNLPGSWHGPARVLMREDPNVVWLSHLSRLYRCAPEHLRSLSSREADPANLPSSDQGFPTAGPQRLGTGVFQYQDLTSQHDP